MGNRQVGFEGGIKVGTTKKEMSVDFPTVKKWTKSLKSMSTDKKIFSKKSIEFYYTCRFKVPTDQQDLSEYLKDAEYATTLPYEERLNFEISKVNVSAHVKHKNLTISDRIPGSEIPNRVLSIFAEIVKIKMLVEYEIHGNEEIRKTIPEIDSSKVDPKVVQNEINQLKNQIDDSEDFELDEILDKINMYGIDSISEKELEFLNRQSKRD